MRRLAVLILAMFALMCWGAAAEGAPEMAEDVDLSALQEIADNADAGIDLKETLLRLASGEYRGGTADLLKEFSGMLLAGFRAAVGMLAGIVAPALIGAVAAQVLQDSPGSDAAQYVCRLCCAGVMSKAFFERIGVAKQMISTLAELSEGIFPILTGLLATVGAANEAAMMTPVAAAFGELSSSVAAEWGTRLATVAAGLAVAGNINPSLSFKRLFGLVRGIVSFAAGAAMTAFMALLSVQGTLGAGYDGFAMRTARLAVDSAIPMIGGDVADAMDGLVASALLVKNAVGATGMLLVVSLCLRPAAELLANCIALRLAAAMLEPAADPRLVRMTDQFSKAMEMLLVVCVSVAMLLLIMLGAGIRAAGGGAA